MFLNERLNSWKENLAQLWRKGWHQERLQVRPLYLPRTRANRVVR